MEQLLEMLTKSNNFPAWLIGLLVCLVVFLKLVQMFNDPIKNIISAKISYYKEKRQFDIDCKLARQELAYQLKDERTRNDRLKDQINKEKIARDQDKILHNSLNVKLVDLVGQSVKLNQELIIDRIKESEISLIDKIQNVQNSIDELKEYLS